MQNSLKLCEGEGSYPSGEVEKAQSTVLGGSKASFWGGVSGESSGSSIAGPYSVLDDDNLFVVQAVCGHAEGEFGDELCVN